LLCYAGASVTCLPATSHAFCLKSSILASKIMWHLLFWWPTGSGLPRSSIQNAGCTSFISLAIVSAHSVLPFCQSSSSTCATDLGSSIPNLCIFFRYREFHNRASLMMAALFLRVCGTHQLNAGSVAMPCVMANSAVWIGCDSLSKERSCQEMDLSCHWQHNYHPMVDLVCRVCPVLSVHVCFLRLSALFVLR
jgi:hypothetical protein